MGLVDLYMRDPDLICVIMMTDVGPERPRQDSQPQALKWGSCTVGQCVIVLEFIYAIKRLARSDDNYDVEVGKMFLIDLERKLGMYLATKVSVVVIVQDGILVEDKANEEFAFSCIRRKQSSCLGP